MRRVKDPATIFLRTFCLGFLITASTTSAWIPTTTQSTSSLARSFKKYGSQNPLNLVRPTTYLDGEDQPQKTPSSASASEASPRTSAYNLGIGKNLPVTGEIPENATANITELYWNVAKPVEKPGLSAEALNESSRSAVEDSNSPSSTTPKPEAAKTIPTKEVVKKSPDNYRRVKRMVAKTQADASLRGAIWDELHFVDENKKKASRASSSREPEKSVVPVAAFAVASTSMGGEYEALSPQPPQLFYPDVDLSIPDEIYSEDYDAVWDLMRWEAFQEAKREPLLVSFLYSSILNHKHLESSLAFLLANRLSSPAMISTQIQSLILEALETDKTIGRKLRADIMAVRDRDPACTCLPDVFLYFKGFHALQTYRVANVLWKAEKRVLAHYLQSQMSQTFQIDIHPNATLGSGIMLDHGTGIVVGETARIGHNCSILHHVTLGGSGKKGVDRHPKVGDGVLIGAGASVLGNVKIGDGCQVGAGTLVITDLPPHSVAVGVPAKIIGSFIDVTEQPSIEMNQMMDAKIVTFQSDGI